MKTVVWLCDSGGWAWIALAELCAMRIRTYKHIVLMPTLQGRSKAWLEHVKEADIIVCFAPQWVRLLTDWGISADKIVLKLGSARMAYRSTDTPLITWICDCPGWAYDILANDCIAHLPGFIHAHVYTAYRSWASMALHIADADLVVVMSPIIFSLMHKKWLNKTILFLDGCRVFEHEHKSTNSR